MYTMMRRSMFPVCSQQGAQTDPLPTSPYRSMKEPAALRCGQQTRTQRLQSQKQNEVHATLHRQRGRASEKITEQRALCGLQCGQNACQKKKKKKGPTNRPRPEKKTNNQRSSIHPLITPPPTSAPPRHSAPPDSPPPCSAPRQPAAPCRCRPRRRRSRRPRPPAARRTR